MSEDKKFMWFTLILLTICVLLIMPVSVSENGLYLFSRQIPLNVTEGIKDAVWSAFFRFSVLISTTVLIILFASPLKRKILNSVFFSLLLFYSIYFFMAIKLGFNVSFFKLNFFYVAYLSHLLAFLILFKRLTKSSLLSSLILILMQLSGGLLVYLYDFSEFLSKTTGIIIYWLYAFLPVSQRMDGINQSNSFSVIMIGIFLSIMIFGIEIVFEKRKLKN